MLVMPRPKSAPIPTENPVFLDEARRLYEPRAGQPLSREDGREIIHNLTGFFETLASWSHPKPADPATGGDGEPR